jgi:ribosomal protein S13
MVKVRIQKKIAVVKRKDFKSKTKRFSTNTISNEFGVGQFRKFFLASKFGIPKRDYIFFKELKNPIEKIEKFIEKKYVFGEFLKKILFEKHAGFLRSRCYRSFKFLNHLPCNGQRTKTNARTSKKRAIHALLHDIRFRSFYTVKEKNKIKQKKLERFQKGSGVIKGKKRK